MRRKIFNVLVIGTMVVSLCSCGKKEQENFTEATSAMAKTTGAAMEDMTAETTTAITVTQEGTMVVEATTDALDVVISEEEIRKLCDENLNCMQNIFVLGMLPTEDTPIQGEWIYQVKEDAFKDYAPFEAYVRSVYCKETADMYLYNYPYEGNSKYLNIEGKLCANRELDGGKGYYVDWSNYTVKIDSVRKGECQFTITCSVEWPAENPVPEEYKIAGKAIYENDKWLLTEMLY